MTWYFVGFTWVIFTTIFYTSGVWIFRVQHRRFPLTWYEVAFAMLISVTAWWLIVHASGAPAITA